MVPPAGTAPGKTQGRPPFSPKETCPRGRRASPIRSGEFMFSRIGAIARGHRRPGPASSRRRSRRSSSAPARQRPRRCGRGDRPAFTWRAVRRAAQYEFQVAADAGFGSIVDKGAFRTRNTAATLKTSLANGTYFWRVRAITAGDAAGRWSRPRSFEKAWMRAPELLEPSDALAMTLAGPAARCCAGRPCRAPPSTRSSIATDPGLANPVVGTATQAGRDAGDGPRASRGARSGHLLLGRHAGGRGQLQGSPLTRRLVQLGLAHTVERAGARSRPGRRGVRPAAAVGCGPGCERVRGRGQPDRRVHARLEGVRRRRQRHVDRADRPPAEQHLPLARARARSRRQPRRVERGAGLQEGVRRRDADGARRHGARSPRRRPRHRPDHR